MAHYQGRRAPNVSQYIANLNTVPPANDMAAQAAQQQQQQQQQNDFGNFDDGDLALFTNTDFFDFDIGAPLSDLPNDLPFNGSRQRAPSQDTFVSQPAFYQGFPAYPPSVTGHSSLPPSPPNGVPFAGQIQQSQPTVPSPSHFATALSSPQTGVPPQQQARPGVSGNGKRKAGTGIIPSAAELEEASRAAAEEDKRRRNTAASARFRVKKKQREQALEKTAKEMSEKVSVLEARIGQLEMQNQWLKGLITEKNVKLEGAPAAVAVAAKDVAAVEGKDGQDEEGDDVDADAEKQKEEMSEESERSLAEKKRGVGTKVEAAKA